MALPSFRVANHQREDVGVVRHPEVGQNVLRWTEEGDASPWGEDEDVVAHPEVGDAMRDHHNRALTRRELAQGRHHRLIEPGVKA